MGSTLLKKALPHLAAFIIIILLSVIYFYPQLSGQQIRSGDIVSSQGMAKELNDVYEQGERPLWTNAMFGGMPAYQIGVRYKGNLIKHLEKIQQLGIPRPIGYFISLMLGCYLLLVLLEVNPWLSLIGAIGFGFSVNHLVLFEAGHMTKLRVISQYGLIIAGVLLVFKKKYTIGGVLFAVGMAIGIYDNHIQMMYYLGIVLAIYVLFEIVQHLRDGRISDLLKAGGILSIGLLLGIGASAANLLTTYEYAKDTMRGDSILANTTEGASNSSSQVDGLAFDYAMQWSNGSLDVLASMIPGIVGGGSAEGISSTSATAIAMRKQGSSIKQAPLYWGALPFTSGPVYIGAIMCFLFILGLVIIKGPIKWWIFTAVLLTFLLSMGKNFDFLSRLFFDYLPMYSKFRAPASITSVTNLLIPLLGILGVSKILKKDLSTEEAIRALFIAGGVTGGTALFFALVGPSLFDMTAPGDARYQQIGLDAAFIADRQSLMRSDSIRTFLLILFSGGLIWAFLKEKIGQLLLLGGLGVLVLFDTWSIGKRYIGVDKFVAPKQVFSGYQLRPVDQEIFALENIDPNNRATNPIGRGGYRVLDMSINTFNSSQTSYSHNTVGGYSAAKLQRFQDLISKHISKGNPSVLNMLNTKYIISKEGKLQNNPSVNGTVWLVDNIKKVTTPNEEINALTKLNTLNDAVILDSEFNNYIGNFDPQKNGTIALSNYKPHHLIYSSNTSSEQLAVFSEIWYGPNKGWQAYVDGNPVEHVRANYALRAMKIPAGNHKIEFKFEPSKFYLGEKISFVSSLLLVLALLGMIGMNLYRWKRELETIPQKMQTRAVQPTPKKIKPTTSRKGHKKNKKK